MSQSCRKQIDCGGRTIRESPVEAVNTDLQGATSQPIAAATFAKLVHQTILGDSDWIMYYLPSPARDLLF